MRVKKPFTLLLSLVIAASLTVSDISALAWETEYLEIFNELAESNFERGYNLTREDFCVAVSKIFITEHDLDVELPFEDIKQIKPENIPSLSSLYKNGILSGVEENGRLYMRPDSSITRAEAITLLGRVLSKSSDGKVTFTDESIIPAYAYGYIAWFAENGIVKGYPDGSFGPSNNMTSGELAALTIRALDYLRTFGTAIETLIGTGGRGHTDGGKQDARFTLPFGILFDNNGQLVVFDTYNNAIRTINSGAAATLTGGTEFLDENGFSKGYYLDGALKDALLNRPSDGVFNSTGELIFADSANNVLRYITRNTVYTYSGTTAGFTDGERSSAKFNNPMAIAIDINDNIYVADTLNNCIRKVDINGKVTTIAGTPEKEGHKDGEALIALFRSPAGIAVSNDGSVVYVADTGNHMIRKIENGQVTTIAGSASQSDDGDPLGGFRNGAAAQAMFNLPRGIVIADGVLIVADSGNNMIRAVTANVVTVAGNGEPGDSEGSCLGAVLRNPSDIHFYDGHLFIADTGNNKVKKMVFNPSAY